jgi:hypothetical protein
LIQEFDAEDIEQSIHPMVTVTPHLSNAIGVQLVSADASAANAVFRPLVPANTALPARRVAQYLAPKDGGDVLVRITEGTREIKVTKPEPKAKKEVDEDEEDSDIDSDEDEEEEDIREIVWKATKSIAEVAVKGVKAGGKIEVTININSDLGAQITAREVGGKGGVRLAVESQPNGSA